MRASRSPDAEALGRRGRSERPLPRGVACSGFGGDDPRAGLSCVDDSQECVDQRQTTLKSMLADQDRKWVKEPTNPQAHASGVRLFAFRSRKKELTCEELALGRREADSVPKTLRGPARTCHRRRSRAPPCSPPRSARSSPPRCARAAARRERRGWRPG